MTKLVLKKDLKHHMFKVNISISYNYKIHPISKYIIYIYYIGVNNVRENKVR